MKFWKKLFWKKYIGKLLKKQFLKINYRINIFQENFLNIVFGNKILEWVPTISIKFEHLCVFCRLKVFLKNNIPNAHLLNSTPCRIQSSKFKQILNC